MQRSPVVSLRLECSLLAYPSFISPVTFQLMHSSLRKLFTPLPVCTESSLQHLSKAMADDPEISGRQFSLCQRRILVTSHIMSL